jgi:diguanylate cyclase (GGDEF)-like protein
MVVHMRRSLLAVLLGAVGLLVVGIGAGVSGHGSAVTGQREALSHRAVDQARKLDDYFAGARSAILLTAHNPVFADFYGQRGSRQDRVRAGGPVLDRANAALGYLEELYPDSIGEACFIDVAGAENARMVRGLRAPVEDLSPDESKNPFFAPTLRLEPGQVHQARPYVSPDTNEWVISTSTVVRSAEGVGRALVHFEVTVESFRRAAAAGSPFPILVVDAGTGAVVVDTRRPQRVGAPLGNPSDRSVTEAVAGWGETGQVRIGDHEGAYQRIAATPGNVNDWYAVALAPEPVGAFDGIGGLAVGLVVVALLLIGYVGLAFRRGHSLLVGEANTDSLTGLHNRRRLVGDLRADLARATNEAPLLLVLCDLNGFKSYNDTFGHPAGDALLARLGGALSSAMQGRGRAYRIGGDEFCVLAWMDRDGPGATIAAATAALAEQGDGFHITASYGSVLLPVDAADAEQALGLVDQRMYEQKANSRIPAARQTRNALLRALQERDPELAERLLRVAELADGVCRRLGLGPAERERIGQAAQLYDIGKMAVPDDILRKPGPLDADEWAFIRHSPLIGERITAAAPSLAPVSGLIRSTRERFDGTGYPDQLAGENIPLGARIIGACAAYAAMTSARPHARTLSRAEAIAELRRSAGTQLDRRSWPCSSTRFCTPPGPRFRGRRAPEACSGGMAPAGSAFTGRAGAGRISLIRAGGRPMG